MIEINKEAEEYVKNNYTDYLDKIERFLVQEDFIAGHNSKATQAKILQAQIDILYEFRDYVESSSIFNDRIFKLQQQLKELENE
jgi:hypothetical protein